MLQSLVAKGHSVTSLVRDEAKGRALAALGKNSSYELIDLKADNLSQIIDLSKKFDVFAHSAGQYTPEGIEFEHALSRAQIALGKQLSAQGKPYQFVYTSGSFITGATTKLSDESFVGVPHPALAWRKGLDDEIIAGAGGKFVTSVIRPSVVYPDSHIDSWIAHSRKTGKILAFQNLDNYVSFISLTDLGPFYRLVMEKRAGGVLHCTDGNPIKLREVVEKVKAETGVSTVESYLDPMPLLHTVGYFTIAQAINSQLVTSRAKELGWTVTQPNWLKVPLKL